jgi:hypothetical protein
MDWYLSHRADRRALPLADRHYNRQKPGSGQFVPPGRCLVLLTADADALWVTSWPLPAYVKHLWPDAWVCSCFRNESSVVSSELIRQAVAATRFRWPDVPPMGIVTFIDPRRVRRKRDWGRCFLRAGFVPCGRTKGGLLALRLTPDRMPPAEAALGTQLSLFGPLPGAPQVRQTGAAPAGRRGVGYPTNAHGP